MKIMRKPFQLACSHTQGKAFYCQEKYMSHTTSFSMLKSKQGHKTTIGYDFQSSFQELAERGEADVAIVSTEEGFSPLGASRNFFENDLGISYENEIKPLANWNLSENEQITLIALASRRPGSLLRGIILAPGNNTRSYSPFVRSYYSRPHRDFYYSVTYEAIAYACQQWGSRKLAISHLSGSGRFHEDIATCQAEALCHFCDNDQKAAPKSLLFCGCCISEMHMHGIRRLNTESEFTLHRSIRVKAETKGQAILLHLDWSNCVPTGLQEKSSI